MRERRTPQQRRGRGGKAARWCYNVNRSGKGTVKECKCCWGYYISSVDSPRCNEEKLMDSNITAKMGRETKVSKMLSWNRTVWKENIQECRCCSGFHYNSSFDSPRSNGEKWMNSNVTAKKGRETHGSKLLSRSGTVWKENGKEYKCENSSSNSSWTHSASTSFPSAARTMKFHTRHLEEGKLTKWEYVTNPGLSERTLEGRECPDSYSISSVAYEEVMRERWTSTWGKGRKGTCGIKAA